MANQVLLGIFTIECIMKIVAFSGSYFYDAWNIFDFIVVVFSITGIGLQALNLGTSIGQVISAVRTLRVGRLLRLIKGAKRLRMLFDTLMAIMPSLFNIGILLFLILFIYAIVGMNIFPYIKYAEGITRNSNFQTFSSSILLLFRVSTGEDWTRIMADCG